jgi:hypothetical protein
LSWELGGCMRVVPHIATGAREIGAPAQAAVKRRAYLPAELAKELGVHPSTLYRWIERGLIKTDARYPFALIPLAEALRFSREGPRP